MNPRERFLAVVLVAVTLLLGGGYLAYRLVWAPWTDRTRTLARLKTEEIDKLREIGKINNDDRPRLAKWRQLSLPADVEGAKRQYERYLNDLLSRSGFGPAKYTITARPPDTKTVPSLGAGKQKEPIYTRLVFTVQGYATKNTLVRTLEDFHRTGLMHQIKNLSIQRQLTTTGREQANELTINLTVEALVVAGADARPWLLPNIDRRYVAADLAMALRRGPSGLGLAFYALGPTGSHGAEVLAEEERDYAVLATKNIFLGRPPPPQDTSSPEWMAPRYVYLIDITTNDRGRTETILYDRSTNRSHKLRATTGWGTFPLVKDANRRAVFSGAVANLDNRDLVYRFQVNAEEGGRSPGDPGFFTLDPKERAKLVADKVIKPGEEDRVFRVDRAYWETLERHNVVTSSGRDRATFRVLLDREGDKPDDDSDRVPPLELTRGKVLSREDDELLVQFEDRYYGLHIGQNVEESLKKALPESRVKEIKVASGR